MPQLGMGQGNQSLYGRQATTAPHTVNLVGCGGGCWVGLFSAMAGTRHLRLFDDDVVELSNLNRLPYPQDWVGKKKTTALADHIRTLRPDVTIEEYPAVRDELQMVLLREGVTVLAIDNLEARKKIDAYMLKRFGYKPWHLNFEESKFKISKGMLEEETKSIMVDTGYANPLEQYVSTATAASATLVGIMMDRTPYELKEEKKE